VFQRKRTYDPGQAGQVAAHEAGDVRAQAEADERDALQAGLTRVQHAPQHKQQRRAHAARVGRRLHVALHVRPAHPLEHQHVVLAPHQHVGHLAGF